MTNKNEEAGKDRNFAKNQKLGKLYDEIIQLRCKKGEQEKAKFKISSSYSGRLELQYDVNDEDYVVVYCELRGWHSEPTLRFKTSILFTITSRKWLTLFSEKTTPEKVLKIILELKDSVNNYREGKLSDLKKQKKTMEKLKKDLGINNNFKIQALRVPGALFQTFELESISSNCKLEIEPSYDGNYSIKFKIDNVKNTNLESVVSELLKLELM